MIVEARQMRMDRAHRLLVDVDPQKAAALGVSSQSIGRTLETMFGSRRATTYIKGGQEYDVILQTERQNRREVSDLEALYVPTGSGQLVPLAAVAWAWSLLGEALTWPMGLACALILGSVAISQRRA